MLRPLILSGGPAVGKTTCGRALAAARPRAAYIDGDDVRQLVLGGAATLWSGPEGRAQHALAARNVAALAGNLLTAGFAVTASDVVTAARPSGRGSVQRASCTVIWRSVDAGGTCCCTRP